MTVIVGPDGRPITKDKVEIRPGGGQEVSGTIEMAEESPVVREVMWFQMNAAKRFTQVLELVFRCDSRIRIGDPDEHDDRKVFYRETGAHHQEKDTGFMVSQDSLIDAGVADHYVDYSAVNRKAEAFAL